MTPSSDDLIPLKPQARHILALLRSSVNLGMTGREIDTALAQETGHGCVDYRKRISELRQAGFQIMTKREVHEGGTHCRYFLGGSWADGKREKQRMGAFQAREAI